jgi:hypothetical protein
MNSIAVNTARNFVTSLKSWVVNTFALNHFALALLPLLIASPL